MSVMATPNSPQRKEGLFSRLRLGPLRAAVLGAGNWGTACAGLVAENARESYLFDDTVLIWVREERVKDEVNEHELLLDELMNKTHENARYLPGVPLPENLVANRDILEVVKDADLLIFILPHQFMASVCQRLVGHVKPGARAITLVKGLHVVDGTPGTFSRMVETILGIECSALSGANVANDVANRQFCETTVGYKESEIAPIWQQLFDRPHFRVHCIPDVEGVQVCGAVKNLIALAAGFCDGLNMGSNTKSAIIRLGTSEMKLFASLFFEGVLEETFFDSCGFADVITTCIGGRNVRCAAEFIRRGGKHTWEEIEAEMLNGQKMQGQLTCCEVHAVVAKYELQAHFPLFETTYEIAIKNADPKMLFDVFRLAPPSEIKMKQQCSASVLYGPLRSLHRKLKDHAVDNFKN